MTTSYATFELNKNEQLTEVKTKDFTDDEKKTLLRSVASQMNEKVEKQILTATADTNKDKVSGTELVTITTGRFACLYDMHYIIFICFF